MNERIIIDVPAMLGVDAETYRKADEGDRQAQKKIVRALYLQDASPRALASHEPWTYWLMRIVGAGTKQTIADFWGVVDLARKAGSLTAKQADALDRLVEQFIGPGTVDPETAKVVRKAFPAHDERAAIDLFLLHDRLASGDSSVTLEEIEQGIQASDDLDSMESRVFFLGVLAQHTAQQRSIRAALSMAEEALQKSDALAKSDGEFARRVGLTAALLRQLYGFVGDTKGATRVSERYASAIANLAKDD